MFAHSIPLPVSPPLTEPSDVNLSFRTGIIVTDAGCILEGLSEYLMPHNYIMPLDLGAKGRYAPTDAL
jgi:hypothetical protein